MNTKYQLEIATVEPYSYTHDGKPAEYYTNDYVDVLEAYFNNVDDALVALYEYYNDNELNVADVSDVYSFCIQGSFDYVLLLSDGEYEDRLRCVKIVEVEMMDAKN